MSPISRGVRNAFRNGIRTTSIILILGLSIGLSLIMLIANKAVNNKIQTIKGSIGNTITLTAAGTSGLQGGGNPLSEPSVSRLSSLPHVTGITEVVGDRLHSLSTTPPTRQAANGSTSTTSLQSAIAAGSLGARFNSSGRTFSPPISAYGTTDTTKLNGTALTLLGGKPISGTTDQNSALIGSSLATTNNLAVGSTFTAYGTPITVGGIFQGGTKFEDNTVIFSLPTLQRLSGQTGQLTSATLTVDSVSNIDSVTAAVKNALGTAPDVTSSITQVQNAIAPLNSVKTVSTFSLAGAIIAGAIIILLTMVMVVRERRHEIGVIKAIGGSNVRIAIEFMVESLTLAVLGAVVGFLLGIVGGQPVTKMLVTNSASSPTQSVPGAHPKGGGFARRLQHNQAVRGINNIKTQIGWGLLLDGFGAAVLISVLGSALAAGMISKVRPSTVMRAA